MLSVSTIELGTAVCRPCTTRLLRRAWDPIAGFFFVHEDFEIKSDLNIVMGLSRDVVYGTFGVKLSGNVPFGVGRHVVSNKDGSRPSIVGVEVSSPVSVQTLDCQSILVHASLFADRPKLRFDENLTFDLYAEDFGLNAVENFNIDLQVFPLDVQHYSYGNITERYVAGLEYLARKYPTVAVPGSCSFIGGRAHELEEHFQYQIPADPRYRSRFARASVRVKSWIASAIRKV